jgi:uncharacterized protein (TIGR02284 family)
MTSTPATQCPEGLIDVVSANEAVFHAAVAVARNDEVRALLLDRAYRFTRAAAALRAMGCVLGDVQSSRRDIPVAPAGDDIALLDECERREDRAIVAFRDALEAALPTEVRRTIEREFERLLGRLGNLRALRDRLVQRERVPQAM